MHIGIVAYEMEGRRSGVGRYLEGLLQGLGELVARCHRVREAGSWRFTLFFKGDAEGEYLELPAGLGGVDLHAVFDHRPEARPILWEQTRLPFLLREHNLDFLFSPAYSLPPFAGVPRMFTLHDLSFEHLPDEFSWRERWRRRHLARLAATRATRILTDTRRVARDVERTYDVPRSKIGIVPLAVDRRFFDAPEEPDEATARRLRELGVRPPYLLQLGSILPRRRVGLLLEAFHLLVETVETGDADQGLRLVLAGADRLPGEGELEERIRRAVRGMEGEGRIVRIPWVEEDLLPALYAGAEASVYLSTYEGYGLPPLESLAAGTPAVVSSGLALDDIWPDYPFRVELELESVHRGLRRVLEHERPEAVAEVARRRLAELDWAACTARWLEEIQIACRAAPAESADDAAYPRDGAPRA